MSRPSPLFLLLVAGLIPVLPASGQPVPKLKPAEKAQAEKAAKAPAAPVVACPSVANYRMLMQGGPSAAVATLNDPKADHLGCAALPRNRIGSVVDRVTLAGRAYDCAAVKDTTVCHWMEAGALPGGGAEGWR
ncbi:hypothetical protein ACFQE0_19805 [Methylobacterium komagatae]|uniref:Secreted protein n=1 Tax=Methylobacterium komagatae TaxID=374425 RepID=A0ABW2BQN4_9HYPH